MSDEKLWARVVEEFSRDDADGPALSDFFQSSVDRVQLVRRALATAGGNRAIAVRLLQRMDRTEQQQLFPELIQLARAVHGPIGTVREIIRSLPREWVLTHIDAEIGQILDQDKDDVYDDYWMFLELYTGIDHARALSLARRAAVHHDPDVQELGADWLSRHSAEPSSAN